MGNYRTALLEVISRLAQPAVEQKAYLQRLGVEADELALEFDDLAQAANAKCQAGELTKREYDTLRELDNRLYKMSGLQNAHLWTFDALSQSNEWKEVRCLANKVIAEMSMR